MQSAKARVRPALNVGHVEHSTQMLTLAMREAAVISSTVMGSIAEENPLRCTSQVAGHNSRIL